MIQQTSLHAFYTLGQKLGKRQQQVFDAVCELGSASNEAIQKQTGLPINVVTPRVKELRDKGYLGFERIGKSSAGRPVMYWSVRNPNDKKLKEVANETHGAAVSWLND